jgi:hypothetical protein
VTDWTQAKTETLRRHLLDIPDLYALAGTMAATVMPRRAPSGGQTGKRADPPAPVNLALLDLLDARAKNPSANDLDDYRRVRDDSERPWERGDNDRLGVLPELALWVRLADGEMWDAGHEHDEPANPPTIVSETGWLTRHLDWITGQQWIDELAADVNRLWRQLSHPIGENRAEYRPRCACGARMRDEGAFFACADCGTTVRDDRMDHRTALANEQPMDAYAFAAFGVMPERIRKWVEREQLEPAKDNQGKPIMRGQRHLYHPLDVLRLADDTLRRDRA